MRFDDYLLRAIEQLTQSVARIVRALRGDQEDEAESEIAGAYEALLAHDQVFLELVDAQTLANLLGAPEKVRVLAQLSVLEAALLEKRGQPARAARLRERAHSLMAIVGRDGPLPGDDRLLSDLDCAYNPREAK